MFNSHRIQSQHQEIISKRLLIFHKLSAMLSRHFLIMLNIYEIKKRPNTMNSPRSDLVSGEMFFAWSHLLSLSVQHSECLNSKNETRAPHLRREESDLLGNSLPPTFLRPLFLFQKGSLNRQFGSLATVPSVFCQPLHVTLTLKACTVRKKPIF